MYGISWVPGGDSSLYGVLKIFATGLMYNIAV